MFLFLLLVFSLAFIGTAILINAKKQRRLSKSQSMKMRRPHQAIHIIYCSHADMTGPLAELLGGVMRERGIAFEVDYLGDYAGGEGLAIFICGEQVSSLAHAPTRYAMFTYGSKRLHRELAACGAVHVYELGWSQGRSNLHSDFSHWSSGLLESPSLFN